SPEPGTIETNLSLVLSPGIAIEGQLLSAQGQPVADALLQVTSLVSNQEGSTGGWGRSPQNWGWSRADARGKFTLTVEASGHATIAVRSRSLGKTTFQAIPVGPGAFADLRFPECSVIHGMITLHNGAPAPRHTIQLTGHAGMVIEDDSQGVQAWGETSGPDYNATTDTAGAYQITGVDPQVDYTASIFDESGTPLATDMELEPVAAGQTLLWNFTIPRPIMVKGVVTESASGQPAAGAVILCLAGAETPDSGVPFALPVAQATTGAGGAFEMRITTGAGEYDFGIQTLTGFHSLAQQEVSEGETAISNLMLPGSWSRRFLVLDESGNPLAGASVFILTEGSDMSYAYPQQTGDDGRIQVTDLTAGEESKCLFRYEGHEAESDSLVGEEGMEFPEETIVIDKSK
ncbi:MAG: carboxypeptidase regulatory-like domain-containing protein, partial [Candidatus Hydrogenedentes bacterium]|nr:carboxypeptidase regulatory-like domain-containing protein [Candidatus Hydrogenedentota bacterium]